MCSRWGGGCRPTEHGRGPCCHRSYTLVKAEREQRGRPDPPVTNATEGSEAGTSGAEVQGHLYSTRARWERVTSTRVTPSLWGSLSSRDGARRSAEASTRRRRRPWASSARGGGHSGGGRSLCSLRPAALSARAERPGAHGPWRSSPVARRARVTSDCEQAARRGGRLSERVDAGRGRAFSPPRPGTPRALPGGGRHARVIPSAPALPPHGWPAGPEARAAPEKSSFH